MIITNGMCTKTKENIRFLDNKGGRNASRDPDPPMDFIPSPVGAVSPVCPLP